MVRKRNQKRVFLAIIGLTILLAIPRFNHTVAPDSTHYVELAAYFAGDFAKEELRTPFTYRVLVPFLASLGPDDTLDINIAALNTLFTAGAFVIFYFYLRELLNNQPQINFGLLLLIVAFPTVNYASGVMTDAAGFFFFVLAAYLFLIKRILPFMIALTIGVLAREALLALFVAVFVYVLLGYQHKPDLKGQPQLLLTFIPPILVVLGVRLFFSDLPSFFWSPSWRQFTFTISRPVAWTTFLLTLLPPLVLLLLAYRRQTVPAREVVASWSFEMKAWLLALTVAGIALNLYSITSAALSGRFVWPFYVVLVPLAAAFFRDDGTFLFRTLGSIADRLFEGAPRTGD